MSTLSCDPGSLLQFLFFFFLFLKGVFIHGRGKEETQADTLTEDSRLMILQGGRVDGMKIKKVTYKTKRPTPDTLNIISLAINKSGL